MRSPRRLLLVALLSGLVVGCSVGGRPVGSPGSGGPSAASSAGFSPKLIDPAAREALLARFGDLAYCDPDVHPVARADEAELARQHLAEMRSDAATWAAIAGRFGFDPRTTPTGDLLLAAYRNWKMLRALDLRPTPDGQRFDAVFSAGGSGSGGGDGPFRHVVGTVRPDGAIVVETDEPGTRPTCPICLARGTAIATPDGPVAVEAVRPGEVVWTLGADGRATAARVIVVGSAAVPPTHTVVRLALADGRAVLVSPGHPLPDGRTIGSLRRGDPVDGSTVASVERRAYDGGRTFDLLPSGPTGTYWADGILLASTIGR